MKDVTDFSRSNELLATEDFGTYRQSLGQESRWRERTLWVVELMIATAGVIAGARLLSNSPGVGLAAIVFSLFGAGATLISRRGAWRTSIRTKTRGIDAAIDIAKRRQRTGWAGLLVCAAALFFLVVVIGSSLLAGSISLSAARSTASAERLLLVVAFAAAFIAVTIIASVIGLRRAIATTAHLKKLRGHTDDDDNGL